MACFDCDAVHAVLAVGPDCWIPPPSQFCWPLPASDCYESTCRHASGATGPWPRSCRHGQTWDGMAWSNCLGTLALAWNRRGMGEHYMWPKPNHGTESRANMGWNRGQHGLQSRAAGRASRAAWDGSKVSSDGMDGTGWRRPWHGCPALLAAPMLATMARDDGH